jgi:pimeloyl-ACP methyl ester carboxylesterase
MSEAPPIVLVHGWGGSFLGTWANTGWREAFANAGRAVVAIDLPGHGRAPASHDPAAYADLASALDEMLPDGALDILGFSLGGKLVLELACRRPDRFRRLAVAGLGDGAFKETGGEALSEALLTGFTAESRAKTPAIAAYIDESPSDYRAIAAVLRRPTNPITSAERLGAITSEIAIINGDADTVAIPDEKLRAALPRAQYVSLPGVVHFSMHRQPSFMRAALDYFTWT